MPTPRLIVLTALAMLAFAGNSWLCRAALAHTAIDPASFTAIRLLAGAGVLGLVAWRWRGARAGHGNGLSGLALFAYAACFAFAYVRLPAGTGALLLFGAVQVTMIGHGLWRGERLSGVQSVGVWLALAGLTGLLWPGLAAPPLTAAALMLAAGVAWGVYSLRGRGQGDPTRVTAGNFLWSLPFALVLVLTLAALTRAGFMPTGFALSDIRLDGAGLTYALASGALTSGIGYAVWYAVLPALSSASAATIQLSVPLITALGGVVLLDEALSARLLLAAAAIVGGIALVIRSQAARG
jgi:drug/metabolite transporter (DMT)-like permease